MGAPAVAAILVGAAGALTVGARAGVIATVVALALLTAYRIATRS